MQVGERGIAGRLGRRGFLIGGAAAAGALVTGCGGSSGSSAGGSIDSFSAVMEGSGADEAFDPGTSHMFIDEARLKAVYDGLFEVDDQMKPIPRLAERAEPNADGTRWRLALRDARWHDGSTFTGDDVLYTISRILGGGEPDAFIAATTLEHVNLRESRVVDPRTVEIALKKPDFEFRTALAAYGTRIVQNGTRDFVDPVGTGPFRFESFEPGKEFSGTSYEQHWNGAPAIRQLRILSADSDARLNTLQGGQADFADSITPAAARTLRGNDRVAVNTTPNSGIHYFAMKTDRPPFDNPDVRRALMLLADREEMVKVAFEGEGDVSNDVFGAGFEYYAELPQHGYDPQRAKTLLRRAGAENLRFDLFTAEVSSGLVEAAHLFAEHAAKAGVRVNVVVGSKDTYYSETLDRGELTMGQSGPLPVPNHFASRLVTGSPQNRTNWSDPEFDALFARAQATRSDEERAAIYRRMHEIQYDRGGFIFFANTYWHNAANAEYRGIPTGVPNSFGWVRFDDVTG
ncbi:ABC transporter substrate-binding protein [Saccharopolyspora sp. HNM0983]|uniref:ABC transporter substrate-binding protein n=1 Tax=Saccharopolyspora montiporae TaxID=2781240 RepID=A0A929B861_9PSEU|nr:ABC transporter substrate-binding protein [Saccharopolyspora sp. HNM0983]MBE9373965.1 ABC transporter substrate-binding protein [Saccharopolyspora sp. HNM0983]